MSASHSALLLIGFQNDYFSPAGALYAALENHEAVADVLTRTLETIDGALARGATVIETPIIFTENYEELVEPVGILETVRDLKAFQAGSPGAETVDELRAYGDRIASVPGKRGLNAFAETGLDAFLREQDITEVALAGVVTSLCIDSTGRSAHERGFRVTILKDCTCGRTDYEQDFYCREVFPFYGLVTDSKSWLAGL